MTRLRLSDLIPRNCHHHRRGPRAGTAAIEFTLLAPLVIFGMVGTMELGRALWIKGALQFAAEETARQATIVGDDEAALIAFAKTRLMALSEDQVTFSVGHETEGDTDFVTVTAAHPVSYLAHLIPGLPATINGAARTSVRE